MLIKWQMHPAHVYEGWRKKVSQYLHLQILKLLKQALALLLWWEHILLTTESFERIRLTELIFSIPSFRAAYAPVSKNCLKEEKMNEQKEKDARILSRLANFEAWMYKMEDQICWQIEEFEGEITNLRQELKNH